MNVEAEREEIQKQEEMDGGKKRVSLKWKSAVNKTAFSAKGFFFHQYSRSAINYMKCNSNIAPDKIHQKIIFAFANFT